MLQTLDYAQTFTLDYAQTFIEALKVSKSY